MQDVQEVITDANKSTEAMFVESFDGHVVSIIREDLVQGGYLPEDEIESLIEKRIEGGIESEVESQVDNAVRDGIEDAMSNEDIDSKVDDAVDNAVCDALRDLDISDKVEDAVDGLSIKADDCYGNSLNDYNLSDFVTRDKIEGFVTHDDLKDFVTCDKLRALTSAFVTEKYLEGYVESAVKEAIANANVTAATTNDGMVYSELPPKWSGIIQLLIVCAGANASNGGAREIAVEQLQRMADALDRLNTATATPVHPGVEVATLTC